MKAGHNKMDEESSTQVADSSKEETNLTSTAEDLVTTEPRIEDSSIPPSPPSSGASESPKVTKKEMAFKGR